MKMWDIALKDLVHSLRSASFWAFGFVVPLLVAGLFYFAFGSLVLDGGFDLPAIRVQVVNLDQPAAQYGGFSAGQILVQVLESEGLAEVLQVSEAADAAGARAAVDSQAADVAVIIPEGFTAIAFAPQGEAAVELYHDPTLMLGPQIVKSIVSQVVDGFSGAKIAASVVAAQLAGRGVEVEAAVLQNVALQYGNWAAAVGQSQQSGLEVRSPGGAAAEDSEALLMVLSLIMAGMMVFYVFFTGATSAQSILIEEENGTLPRLFTTPTRQSLILGGKFIAALVTLVVQVLVLVVVSALVFGIDWGAPLPVALVTLGLVVLAASFGLFVTSLLKNVKQSGIVYGGVMTVLGMLGMMGTFTAGASGDSQTVETVALLVPQGWGVRGWQLLLEGGGLGDVLPTVAVMLGLGAVFFVVGLLKFRRRFA